MLISKSCISFLVIKTKIVDDVNFYYFTWHAYLFDFNEVKLYFNGFKEKQELAIGGY
jgi:hypothetical protein